MLYADAHYCKTGHILMYVIKFQAEENERNRIENEKETERRKATEDLERWKEEQRQNAEQVFNPF